MAEQQQKPSLTKEPGQQQREILLSKAMRAGQRERERLWRSGQRWHLGEGAPGLFSIPSCDTQSPVQGHKPLSGWQKAPEGRVLTLQCQAAPTPAHQSVSHTQGWHSDTGQPAPHQSPAHSKNQDISAPTQAGTNPTLTISQLTSGKVAVNLKERCD